MSKDKNILLNEEKNNNKLYWKNEYMNKAVKMLLGENNTNFESVIKNLQNNIELYKIVKKLVIQGEKIDYNIHNPIINGTGFAVKEVQTSEEKRLDIAITYGNEMNIIETKLWRGEVKHKQGLEQLWDYLNIHNLECGYLLIFDFRKEENRDKTVEKIKINGKKVFTVWV